MPKIEDPQVTRERVKKKMTVLGIGLLVAGAAVLLLMHRIPLPLRLLIGFGDLIAGATLLVLVRQKFGR
jgi:hypothetical protein